MSTYLDTLGRGLDINFTPHYKEGWVIMTIREHKKEYGHSYEMPVGTAVELKNQITGIEVGHGNNTK